jgi:predicted porin
MKKYLLSTTAVVAATACSGAANAQSASEPITLGLGGYWRGAFAQQVGGNGAVQNQRIRDGMQQDSLIVVSGASKFDNGLHVGVSVQFRGEGANSAPKFVVPGTGLAIGGQDTVKRSYVRFFGDFGEIRFGDDEDSRLQKQYDAPQAGSLFGVNSPFITWTNNPVGTNSTNAPIGTKRGQRIAYFSPTFAGFSFAVSYMANDHKGNLSPVFFQPTGTPQNAGQQNNQYSVAGSYDNKFGDFRLQSSLGYTKTTQAAGNGTTTAPNNRSAYDGGLVFGFGPFQFGSSFEHQQGLNGPGNNSNVFDVGAVYTTGSFATSLNWSRGYYQNFAGPATARLDIFEIIVDYVLGPGVSLGAAFQYNKYRSGVANVNGNVATQDMHDSSIQFGTGFTF